MHSQANIHKPTFFECAENHFCLFAKTQTLLLIQTSNNANRALKMMPTVTDETER